MRPLFKNTPADFQKGAGLTECFKVAMHDIDRTQVAPNLSHAIREWPPTLSVRANAQVFLAAVLLIYPIILNRDVAICVSY